MTDTQPPAEPNGPTFELLRQMERGDFLTAIDAEVDSLVEELRMHAIDTNGKAAGSLTIKVDMKLDGGMVEVTGTVKGKHPERAARRTILWMDGQGRMTSRDPRQGEFDIPSTRRTRA